jgi:acetyl esterase/lipase
VILIIPGGGYHELNNEKEQEPVAKYFVDHLNVTAMILYYRLVQKDEKWTYHYPVPMWDGRRAVKLIRSRMEGQGLSPVRLAVFGFSAGGHLASTLALHPDDDFGLAHGDRIDDYPGRVDLLGLGYPVISMYPFDGKQSEAEKYLLGGIPEKERVHLRYCLSGEKHVSKQTPPVFLFESKDDIVVSAKNSELFIEALKRAGVPEMDLLCDQGKHGCGLCEHHGNCEVQWPELFRQWLIRQKFIER